MLLWLNHHEWSKITFKFTQIQIAKIQPPYPPPRLHPSSPIVISIFTSIIYSIFLFVPFYLFIYSHLGSRNSPSDWINFLPCALDLTHPHTIIAEFRRARGSLFPSPSRPLRSPPAVNKVLTDRIHC